MKSKKNKFKVGDMVQLSAAGSKLNHNGSWYGGFGIIKKIATHNEYGWQHEYPIACAQWDRSMNLTNARFKPYELKKYKKNT